MNINDRDEIARQFLDEALGRIDPSEMLSSAQVSTPEAVAKEIADLAFAIADAMIAKSQSGESK